MAVIKTTRIVLYGLSLLFLLFLSGLNASPLSRFGLPPTSAKRADDFYLRIMPLGASITYGDPAEAASLGRGYRKFIRDYLRSRDWQVNMVGSRNFGQFADNDVEGWPGAIIDGVADKSSTAVPKYKPNLILINVGTNDATGNVDLENAGGRIEALVRTCFDLSPGVVVVLSTLLPNRNAPDNAHVINVQYRNVVIKLLAEGFKIQLADMDDGFISLDMILPDGTHPTIEGQERMAAVWALAIHEVEQKGNWLQPPSTDVDFRDDSSGSTCEKVYNSGAQDPRNGMHVLRGTSPEIKDDGNYVHKSTPRGEIWRQPLHDFGHGPPAVYAAQIVNLGGADRGGERDDIIQVDNDNTAVNLFVNRGDGTAYDSWYNIVVEGHCITRGIRWGDVNNDGLDDFICIDTSGNMFVSINEGTTPVSFRDVGQFKDAVSGYSQKNVRLGDIDGDGRLDYCVINESGSVHCWRNGGIMRDKAEYWQDMGVVFTPPTPIEDIAMMKFVDINGDFRADILWVDENGRIRTWINQRGNDKSMVPYWRDAGVTHLGMNENVGGPQNIIFGRMNSGRPSYLYLHNDLKDDVYQTRLEFWENQGSGGTHQKGDGARWGDMTGTGNDDYVWIDPDGVVVIFPNVNTPPDTSNYPNWGVAQVALKTGMDRKALHIGDWNNDGKADVIGVDKKTGALTVWLTSYSNGVISFDKRTSGSTYCTEGWGVGLLDIGAHFADITGSGCVDYMCMAPDGRTTAWLNDCKSNLFDLRNVGQVKFSENLDRANHRFADVNGDGLADFMWVDKFTGDASVWINQGEQPEDQRPDLEGSKFRWDKKGPSYAGSTRGPNLHYPNLGGIGRADQVQVDPNTAQGSISFNTCPAGGDDGGIKPRDPGLPDYAPEPVCSVSICRIDDDVNTYCGIDPFADDFADDDYCDEDDVDPPAAGIQEKLYNNTRLAVSLANTTLSDINEEESSITLAAGPPGKRNRSFDVVWTYLGIVWQMRVYARNYPGSTHLHDPTRGPPAPRIAVRMDRTGGCSSSDVEVFNINLLSRLQILTHYDTEHNPDLQMLQDFAYTLATSILPGGETSQHGATPASDIKNYWEAPVLPRGLPMTGTSRCITAPSQYLADQIGSHGNRAGMILCEKELNQMKGRVFNLNTQAGITAWRRPIANDTFDTLLENSLSSVLAQNQLFEALTQVVGVWRYINNIDVRPIVVNNINNMQNAADQISANVPQLYRAGPVFREFYPAWYRQAARNTRQWMADRITDIIARYTVEINNGTAPPNADRVRRMLNQLFDDLVYIVSPWG